MEHYGIPIKPLDRAPSAPNAVSVRAADRAPSLYLATIPARLFGGDAAFPWLADEEAAAAAAMASRKRRVQYATGRLLLRHALRQLPGADTDVWRIVPAASGRLELQADGRTDAPCVSVSHSGALVLCGVAAKAVLGVDLERCVPRRTGWEALADFTLHPIERVRLADLDARERWRAFYRAWTLKEALAKATGVGLALPFNRIAFTADDRFAAAPVLPYLSPEAWRFASLPVGEDAVGAVAWRDA